MTTISDITISYQNRDGLKCTLDSLFGQRLEEYDLRLQVIVVDGGSSDGSRELLEEYDVRLKAGEFSKSIDFTYISEPDKGIYNAMNKGIQMAGGEWVLFLNSGDTMSEMDSLGRFFTEAGNIFLNVNDIDILYGDSDRAYNNNCNRVAPSPLTFMVRGLPFSHQACFTKLDLFKKRPYDESYEISGDYEWFLNAYMNGCRFGYAPVCVSRFDTKGISATRLYDNWVEADRIRDRYGLAGTGLTRKLKRLSWYILDKLHVNSRIIEKINSKLASNLTFTKYRH